jgi:hypothetical protein
MHSSPFRRILGPAFETLPEALRRFHDLSKPIIATGLADVVVAPGLMPPLICLIAGLPSAGREVPVTVAFTPERGDRQRWQRRFGHRRYSSSMYVRDLGNDAVLTERIGLFELDHRLAVRTDGLLWQLVGWRFLRIPLPAWTLPGIKCLETQAQQRFCFEIDVAFPFIGPVLHYRGWLEVS